MTTQNFNSPALGVLNHHIRAKRTTSGSRVRGFFSSLNLLRYLNNLLKGFFCILCLVVVLLSLLKPAFAEVESQDFPHLADAIFKAENSKNHPYGILKPYCAASTVSQCRKGCLQTIEKRYKMWLESRPTIKDSNSFIAYLSKSYAPIGATNDPAGLNKHWIKNVTRFYQQRRLHAS